MIVHLPSVFSIRTQCGRGCGHDWSRFFILRVYSTLNLVFDLTVGKVVVITRGDFLTCQVYSVFNLTVGEVVGMTGGDFSPTRCIQ